MLRGHGEPFSHRVSVMRANLISVLALGLLTAACGSNETQRAATGGLTGIGAGALIGGPIGAVVGGAVGAVAGSAMPEGADTLTAKALHKEQGATAEALNDAGLGNGSSRSAQVSGKGSSVPTGQSSHLIKDAQAELQREGLYKGRIDGIDGPQTQQAVRDFQRREGLQQTAVLDQPTLERMNLTGEAQTAERTGADVAGSGTSSPPAALSANDIRSRLEQAGYTHVRDLQRQANLYTARAEQNDTGYRLRVDARSGQVLSQHRLAASQQSGAAQAPSATPAGGNEANPNVPVPANAPGAVGSDNANANVGTTNSAATAGTTSMPSTAAPSVAPSSGSSTPSTGAAASGTSSHGSDLTPPTPDQQSGGGAGNTTGSNPSR
jgi:peptidoglycan hydrolase-like protein with peptidoglycan-binding domain